MHENPDGETRSEDEHTLADEPANDKGDAAEETGSPARPWMKVAVMVGGVALTAAGAVVATLAATHKTAVTENAKAYVNGMNAALDAVRNGYDPFDS